MAIIRFRPLKKRLYSTKWTVAVLKSMKGSLCYRMACWCRGTSLNRKRTFLGTYSRTLPRALQWPNVGGSFLGDGYNFDPKDVPVVFLSGLD